MSQQRHCAIWKATDGLWYMELGAYEYHEEPPFPTYGPFKTFAGVEIELERHSNPGGWNEDDSGTQPPPAKERLVRWTEHTHTRKFFA